MTEKSIMLHLQEDNSLNMKGGFLPCDPKDNAKKKDAFRLFVT